jgi:hypothetical protein
MLNASQMRYSIGSARWGLLPFIRHFLEKEPLLITALVWEKEAPKKDLH